MNSFRYNNKQQQHRASNNNSNNNHSISNPSSSSSSSSLRLCKFWNIGTTILSIAFIVSYSSTSISWYKSFQKLYNEYDVVIIDDNNNNNSNKMMQQQQQQQRVVTVVRYEDTVLPEEVEEEPTTTTATSSTTTVVTKPLKNEQHAQMGVTVKSSSSSSSSVRSSSSSSTKSKTKSIPVPWSEPVSFTVSDNDIQFWNTFIILLEVNDGYYNFFLNWLYFYDLLKMNNDIYVIAEDDVVFQKLQDQFVNVSNNNNNNNSHHRSYNVHVERSTNKDFKASALTFGSDAYKNLVSGRAGHILQRLKSGQNVIYTDVDTVWKLNPLPYLIALQDNRADTILQVDNEWKGDFSPGYCTGFMAFISNTRTIALITKWNKALLNKPSHNQPIFNTILHKRSYGLKHQPLPNQYFPNGEIYFNVYNTKDRDRVVVVHNNFIKGIDNKLIRFQQNNLWMVE